jgi:hypothetical protein
MGDFHMDIDGLAPMIFLKNPNDLPIKLNLLDPIENGKDLFFFLLDLFFKGIYYVSVGHYGNCEIIKLSELTLDTVFKAIRKLRNINVKVVLSISEDEEFDTEKVRYMLKSSIARAKSMADNLKVTDFMVYIPLNYSVYELRFDLM